MIPRLIILSLLLIITACQGESVRKNDKSPAVKEIVNKYPKGTFGYDLEILQKHHDIIVLSDPSEKAEVAVSPDWQGRVMTSSFDGREGISLGWINHDFILSREVKQDMNPFGGEDRIWFGPEGGQFSLFFKHGVPFDLATWKVPEEIDIKPFDVIDFSKSNARFSKNLKLVNYSGHAFDFLIEREINLLSRDDANKIFGISTDKLELVSFESVNRITNTGEKTWDKETGALSVWILGMFQADESATIMIPYKTGDTSLLGPVVNDHYFIKIPPERLVVKEGIIFFKGDGKFRCKLGVSPKRAKPFIGAYNAGTNVLTIVNINLPADTYEYVNSLLEIRDDPFSGDVYNSYNDGPTAGGTQFGSYFELETSSPAAFLSKGGSITHINRTIHLSGDRKDLDEISKKIFGVSLDEAENAFRQD